MTTTNATIAKTILQQLGGGKFWIMTGAKDLVIIERGAQFHIGRNAAGVTHVRITLTAMDDYQIEFLRIRGVSVKPVAFREGIYDNNLASVFQSVTKMYTSLGTMAA